VCGVEREIKKLKKQRGGYMVGVELSRPGKEDV
jgi:hypothetical protein